MSWFSRYSWCGGSFNGGNCRYCTNVSFRDEPVYDSNLNYYNQTSDFSNPPPYHNYEIDSRSDTGAALQAEFTKLQQNFERFMAQLSCSYCGGLFNSRNCPSCSIVGAENEFVHNPNPLPYDNTPNFSYQPPHHHVETYSCELCGNDSHYGYDFPPWFSQIKDYRNERIDICYKRKCEIKIDELKENFNKMSIEINKITKENELRQREQAANLSIYTAEPSEYDLSFCGNSMTFSNPLFDSNDDFSSSDDESLSDEDVLEDNVKIYSNPLFEFDDEYISSEVNPLFDEVLENIENKDSYDSNLDEPALLVTPLFDSNEDECFDPGGDIDEINTSLDNDIFTDIEDVYQDSKGYVLYLERLHSDDTTLNFSPEVFLDHDLRSLSDINDLKILVKVFDPEISEKFFSRTYVSLPFKDRHYLFLTYVIRIVFLISPIQWILLFFSPLEVRIAPDYEDSRACGFVHCLLELLSLTCLYIWESDILDLVD
nr:hypothetical protein [Tanacetum cinerariifolium]GEW84284.1 hypothetical protein [Tanacetum cinerariifolium]GEW85472.1 hypothetical protein [Tanacetum cinerariifolium]